MTALHSPFRAGRRFTDDDAVALASPLKALASPARLRIIALLGEHGPMTGAELMPLLRLSQPAVSHHLKTLDAAGLIRTVNVDGESRREVVESMAARLSDLIHPFGPRPSTTNVDGDRCSGEVSR